MKKKSAEEQYLLERLRLLHEQYRKDAAPYIKRLAALRSPETPPIYVRTDSVDAIKAIKEVLG